MKICFVTKIMVTTIKITCDGVFIQSNSFLTATNTISTTTTDDTLQTRDSSTDSSTTDSLISTLNSTPPITPSTSTTNTINSDKDKSITATIEPKINSANSSPKNDSITRKSSGSNSSYRAKRPRTPKCDNRRRYYFGSNKIYWCKQSGERSSSSNLTCCLKSEVGGTGGSCNTTRYSCKSLQRSASSVTHKELQQHKSHSYTGRSKHKPLTATSSLSAVPNPHHHHTHNSKTHPNYLQTFYNLNKCQTAALKSQTPKTISGATSIFLVNGFSVNSSAYNNNKCYATDTRLLSFLRSARKLYRNSVRVNDNNINKRNGSSGSPTNENTKVNCIECNATNNNLNKTKNRLNENETKQNQTTTAATSIADKIKQTYIFGVKTFATNNHNHNNNNNNNQYFNNKNKTKNDKNIEDNKTSSTTLTEEWFG